MFVKLTYLVLLFNGAGAKAA